MKLFTTLFAAFILMCLAADAQTITTFTTYDVSNPQQLAFGKYRTLFMSTGAGEHILDVDSTGYSYFCVGTGYTGFAGDGAEAIIAQLNHPDGVMLDTFNNLYISDAYNNRVRKVSYATGYINTIAGSIAGYSGDGGPAESAQLNSPGGLCIDKYQNLYVADIGNYRIRKITATGTITTVAGNGTPGTTEGDGGPAVLSACSPTYLCIDTAGDIYFINQSAHCTIRKISSTGIISTIAGDTTGSVYYDGDGIPALGAGMGADGIAIDPYGNLVIADSANSRVRLIDHSGIIHTIAGNGVAGISGDGGPADSAQLSSPSGLAYDRCGNLYIGQNTYPRIRKLTFANLDTVVVSITATADTVCAGTIVTFTAVSTSSLTAAYHWSVNGYSYPGTTNTFSSTPANGDSVQCVISVNGCYYPRSNKVHITVVSVVPAIAITANPGDTICGEIFVTFTENATNTGSGATYQWIVNGLPAGIGDSSYTYLPLNGDSIRCVLTTGAGICGPGDTVSSNSINIFNGIITPTITINGPTWAAIGSLVTFHATVADADTGCSIKWYDNGVFFATTTSPVVSFTKTNIIDSIVATVVPAVYCHDTAQSAVSYVTSPASGVVTILAHTVDIYPNPVATTIVVDNPEGDAAFVMQNLTGATVLQSMLHSGRNSIDIRSLPAGVYVVEITEEHGERIVKMMVKESW